MCSEDSSTIENGLSIASHPFWTLCRGQETEKGDDSRRNMKMSTTVAIDFMQ